MLFPAAPTLEEEHAESYVSLPVSMFGNGTFEKDLNTLAVENNIQPNLLRNWKKDLMTSVRITSRKSLPKNARKKRSMQKRLVS